MKRVDLFAVIHKALRLQSARVVGALANCAGDLEATGRALRESRELLEMQIVHARVEETFVVAAIEARRPGAASRLTEAHEEHAVMIERLRTQIDEVERHATPARVHALYLEMTRFIADDFLHMFEEETLAQPLLEECYSQPELAAIAARARESVTPAEERLFAPLVLASLSTAEREVPGSIGKTR
ncbi:MAG: hemerythrin domain-containing protein [Deltaproteobacteria bacterium]|nr:hemerythrin domain-containing protein [Deltaproteobacteria bacterium]